MKAQSKRKVIDDLFKKFGVIYGMQWSKLYKTLDIANFAKEEWADAVEHFTEETIEKAYLHCRGGKLPYPPSLPKFIEICKNFRETESRAAVKQNARPADPKVAEYYLNQIREMLNSRSKEAKA